LPERRRRRHLDHQQRHRRLYHLDRLHLVHRRLLLSVRRELPEWELQELLRLELRERVRPRRVRRRRRQLVHHHRHHQPLRL
jgi:hypothetical protein